MNILYLSAALLFGAGLYNYGDILQAQITAMWGRLSRSWMDKTNPWPVWLFTLGFIALIGAFFK